MKLLVSLVSDQTLPNTEFILSRPPADKYLFIDTEKTRNECRANNILNACKIPDEKALFLLVDANHPVKVFKDFENEVIKKRIDFSKYSEIEVNITGGTKIMSLLAYSYFKNLPRTIIYYIPVNTTKAYQVWPDNSKELEMVELDLETYLAAYGYRIMSKAEPKYSFAKSQTLFRQVIAKGHAGGVPDIKKSVMPGHKAFDKNYMAGGWFEEWLFYEVKKNWNLTEENIALNMKLRHLNSESQSEFDNEIDLAFVSDNNLFLLEAKVYPGSSGKISADKIYDPMYKLAALQKSLGLHAQTHVFILCPFGTDLNRMKTINQRRRILGLNGVWSLEDMKINPLKKIIT